VPSSPRPDAAAGAERVVDLVLVLFVVSVYVLETDATAGYFQVAQAVLLVTATAVVVHSGRVQTRLLLPWSAALLASAALATVVNQSGISTEARTFFLNGVLALAFLQLLSSERRVLLALSSFGIAGVLASVSLMTRFDASEAASTTVEGAWALRLGSTLPGSNPNIAGMYLAIAFAAALSRALTRSARAIIRLVWLAGCVLIILGITLTGSRKAVLYCLVAAVILVAHYSLRLLPILAGAGAVLAWAMLNVEWLYILVGHRLVGLGDVLQADAIRAQALSDSLEAFMRSPFGTGWGSSDRFLSGLNYTHSNYLEVLVSLGIVGLLIYYWAPVSVVVGARHIAPAVRPAITALMLAGLVIDVVQVTYLYKAPILVIALGAAALYTAHNGEVEPSAGAALSRPVGAPRTLKKRYDAASPTLRAGRSATEGT
jgi:O-antigen ligase/polysaccharide polymerase Wzy-like membrane protein